MSGTKAATPLAPDICVIGAGPAGLGVATAAALFGVSVILIERSGMGAERLNAGSLPAAALIAASRQAHAAREAGRFGIATGTVAVNHAGVHDHVQRVVASMAPNVSAERLQALGITLLQGEARFASRSTVMVGEQAIKARRFVIATGARPTRPRIAGLDTVNTLSSESLAALTRLPERLLVLGGEPAAVELAQAMARLGSRVTLIDPAEILPEQDPEAVMLVRRGLLRDGVTLHEHATVLRATAVRGGVRLALKGADAGAEQEIEGSHLLVAAGREPDIAALDLQLGGITSDAEGVIVDGALRTGNRRVFAIGDCIGRRGGSASTQTAEHHAGLVMRSALFRLSAKVERAAIPRLVQCSPEVASVGISEDEARHRGAVTILRWPYAENDRARAGSETDGFVKIVTGGKGHILGATIVGAGAGELIAPWCMAVRRRLTVTDMAELVLPSPSLSEISRRVAASSYVSLAAKPIMRRLIGFLRRFG